MTKKQEERLHKKQAELLRWILSEWDCHDLEEAKQLAQEDRALHLKLREAGVTFEDQR